MAATRKYGTAPLAEIMESDLSVCIKKAKSMRYKNDKEFYIIKTSGYYFAVSSMVGEDQNTLIQKWVNQNYSGIENSRSKWICEIDNSKRDVE